MPLTPEQVMEGIANAKIARDLAMANSAVLMALFKSDIAATWDPAAKAKLAKLIREAIIPVPELGPAARQFLESLEQSLLPPPQ